ncbi:MAG: metallophosphatase family protein [Desulfovibrionales bacterium]|nr:metallophosphatase family protein [Desulfovibrionales bacterium]
MRLAVISDIHGNLEAFEQVLADMETTRPEHVISLGDNIGYGPDSQAVMEIIMAQKIPSILGNHEMVVKHPRFLNWFNPPAQKALGHALKTLSPKAVAHIKKMEACHVIPGKFRFVHGCPPASPFLYLFQLKPSVLAKKIQAMAEPVCISGHSHDLEYFQCIKGRVRERKIKERRLCLSPPCIFTAGSVGQPRDGDPRAKYALVDTDSLDVEIRQCPYDFKTTRAKMKAAGIPKTFRDRLGQSFKNEE